MPEDRETDPWRALADSVVDRIWQRLRIPIGEALKTRLEEMALERFRFKHVGGETMNRVIDQAIERMLENEYKPLLEEIARRKAKAKVVQRAQKNGIDPKSLPWEHL